MTEEAQRLVNEIFQITGQKVELDDPLVIAALFNASLVRNAGQEAAAVLNSEVGKILNQAKSLAVELAVAKQDIAGVRLDQAQSKAMVDAVIKIVGETVRAETKATVRGIWTTKVLMWNALPMGFLLAVGFLAGASLSPFFSARHLSAGERQQIQIGKRLQEVIPMLDKETKEKLKDALSKN